MVGVLEPITFTTRVNDEKTDLIVPKEFIRDIDFHAGHLMIYIRVTGPDTDKVSDFFDSESKSFQIETTENEGGKISDEFILTSSYLDEGPPLSVDIDSEPPMVRAILDFKKK